MDFKLEVVVLPVSDVDRAKDFYENRAGFHLDHDVSPNEHMRVVQLTPPGSACSIVIGVGGMEPGSIQGLQLTVADIEAARAQLEAGGVAISEVRQMGEGSGSKFAFFTDPDGNGWAIQEITA
jgi:catechol 2,3-dioxygenase-like lactoylglutathione lyase family enzyme